jgi:3-dehydroquinate dehydratase II
MHGVNLDQLGRRPAAHYGGLTFEQLVHRADELADGLLLNPGAWTHYSYAIRDALEIAAVPAIEVHLSDIASREEFRRHSVISDLCLATVSGQGPEGYREGLARLKQELAA